MDYLIDCSLWMKPTLFFFFFANNFIVINSASAIVLHVNQLATDELG